jgi:hypothetical protein
MDRGYAPKDCWAYLEGEIRHPNGLNGASRFSNLLPLRDHQWLVSEDHLKRARVQKTTAETP